jgi:predicted membrane protein
MRMNMEMRGDCSRSCGPHQGGGGAAFGIIIIAAGVLWLLSRMGVIQLPGIHIMWPSIIIAFGFIKLFHRPFALPNMFFGLTVMAVGTVLQLGKLGLVGVDIHMIWPFLLILAGILVIWTSSHHKRQFTTASTEDHINKNIMFGGDESHFTTKQFRGGVVTAIFGGAVLDLRQAEMAESPTTIEISAIFGGVEIRVPSHWRVVVHGSPVLGGFDNKSRLRDGLSEEEIKTLIIQGNVVFGGAEIKN